MTENLFHAMIWVSSWGDDRVLLRKLKDRPEIYSIFHIMGTASYLLDVFVNQKKDLRDLVFEIKRYTLPQVPVPIVTSMSTQKVLKVYKHQKDFNIAYYSEERIYGFTRVFNKGPDDTFILNVMGEPRLKTILRLQGGMTFLLEIMASTAEEIMEMTGRIKEIPTVQTMETQEVLAVIKYRGVVFEDPTAPPKFIAPIIKPGDIVTL